MRHNRLPDGKLISALGFGVSSICAQARFGDSAVAALLRTASECGINHFDTGASYGWGLAEKRLGAHLKTLPSGAAVVSTKAGSFRGNGGQIVKDFTPKALEVSLSDSLARLGLERVDIFYLHGPSAGVLAEPVYRFFEREKQRGRIGLAGVNSFEPSVLALLADSPIDAIMLQYNVADLSALPLLDGWVARGKTLVAATVLAQGMARSYPPLPTSLPALWYLARALRNGSWRRGRALAHVLARHDLSEPSDPLRWVLGDPRIASGIFGSSQMAHVRANAAAAERPLDATARDALMADLSPL